MQGRIRDQPGPFQPGTSKSIFTEDAMKITAFHSPIGRTRPIHPPPEIKQGSSAILAKGMANMNFIAGNRKASTQAMAFHRPHGLGTCHLSTGIQWTTLHVAYRLTTLSRFSPTSPQDLRSVETRKNQPRGSRGKCPTVQVENHPSVGAIFTYLSRPETTKKSGFIKWSGCGPISCKLTA